MMCYAAGVSGCVERVQEMLQLKPSLATIEDKDGVMPLMFASNKGHKKVRLLESYKRAPEIEKTQGYSLVFFPNFGSSIKGPIFRHSKC